MCLRKLSNREIIGGSESLAKPYRILKFEINLVVPYEIVSSVIAEVLWPFERKQFQSILKWEYPLFPLHFETRCQRLRSRAWRLYR